MMKKIKAVVFDLNGVIIDSNKFNAELFKEVFSKYGENVANAVANHYLHNGGIPRKLRMEMYLRDFANIEPTYDRVIQLLDKFSRLLKERLSSVPLVKGVKDFLEKNRDKYLFFISSGALPGDIKRILTQKDIIHYFTGVYGSPFPKNEHLKDIMSEYNLSNNEVVFIGDSIHDYDAAKQTGVCFVGMVTPENHWNTIDSKIRDITELEDILAKISKK